MTRGSKVHEQLEKFLLTGKKPDVTTTEGLIASQGIELLPATTSDTHVEISLEEYPLPNLPVPFKGFIDVLDVTDGVHVLDHKTTSAWKWAKTEDELTTNMQLIIYARHVLEHHPDQDEAEVTHVYYLTRPPHGSKKVSAVVSRKHVFDEFDKILVTVNEMVDASQNNLDHLHKNKADCYSYGKQCPHYNECWHTIRRTETLPMSNRQEAVLDFLRETTEEVVEETTEETTEEAVEDTVEDTTVTIYFGCKPLYGDTMSLIDHLAPLMREVCIEKNVAHIGLIPYAQGWDLLAAKLQATGLPNNAYYVPTFAQISQRLSDTLIGLADQVVISG
jgi:hypothetical protein